MLILLILCLIIGISNLLVSIGIAGSVVRLIEYLNGDGVLPPRREVNSLPLPDREPYYDGVAPRPPNSDGAGGVFDD